MHELRTAARRGDPWLIALTGAIALAVIVAALAWITSRGGPPASVPAPRPQPAPTTPLET